MPHLDCRNDTTFNKSSSADAIAAARNAGTAMAAVTRSAARRIPASKPPHLCLQTDAFQSVRYVFISSEHVDKQTFAS
jgi:hypothetical protein